ncbi:MAG: acyl--CoA ligase [Pseudomonadota bacterium]|nr:acyl--CoA ligase [Pseudomonadota bacterium]
MRTELIRPIGELVRHQAESRGDSPAYENARRAVTYAQLADRTGNLAGHLQDLGLHPEQSVALMLPNSVDWIEACFGVARAGGVAVPISYEATRDEVAYRLADARCAIAVTTDEQAGLLSRLLREQGRAGVLVLADRAGDRYPEGHRLEDLLARPARSAPRDPAALDAPRFIVYTSGTTGRAKGVKLTERSMLWVTAACWAPIAGLGAHDRVLSPLPLFHSYALNLCVLGILATGASEYILERFSVRDALVLIEGGRFTLMPGVPTMFHYLLDACRAAGRPMGRPVSGKLRLCLSAGAIMPGPLNEEFEAHFGAKLLDGYGITETSTMVTLNWPSSTRVMGSCGLPLPGLAVRLLDPATGKDAAPGAEGELVVRGPNLMLGYHDKPAETAAALREGWYHTGDLARSDPNGFLTITGRLKELIIRGGQNIAPAEVEQVVTAYAPVLDCAVVGIAHEHLGEVPIAVVVARAGQTIDPPALVAHCAQHLSAYKVPVAVHVVGEIFRTGSGKIMRYRLRELLQQSSA